MITLAIKWFSFSVLIILSFAQCQSTKRSRFLKKEYKSIYIDQFKLIYIDEMLIKGYNNSKAIQEIIKFDHSGFTERILTEDDYKLIDSLTTIDNQKMVIDSSWGKQRAEGSEGKRPLGFIFNKFSGKWLDSIARKRYKKSGLRNQDYE